MKNNYKFKRVKRKTLGNLYREIGNKGTVSLDSLPSKTNDAQNAEYWNN